MNNIPCGTDKKIKEGDICKQQSASPDTCWIEKPKFFPGQLLTDADLSAGQNYVIEKNKLHNRYLHGWGVVCGLKVKCYPCCTGHGSSGKVVVEPGYAIDCCGNDIVVCDEQEYDVVRRMNQLKMKKKAASDPCSPSVVEEETTCNQAEDKYYLVLSYKEVDAKPETALKAKDGCSIQRCMPSRTKECFELDLIEYCTLEKRPDETAISRASKCVQIFIETWKKLFADKKGKTPTAEEFKEFIREYHKALSSHVRCDVLDQLDAIKIPGDITEEFLFDTWALQQGSLQEGTVTSNVRTIFADNNYPLSESAVVSKIDNTNWRVTDTSATYRIELGYHSKTKVYGIEETSDIAGMWQLLIYLLLDCLCQALFNPCPQCTKDDVVILATITVKNKKIDRICNFARKRVMTFPTLFYWIPVNNWIGDAVKHLCCDLDLRKSKSAPLREYGRKMVENEFALPRAIFERLQQSLKILPKSLLQMIDPRNVSLQSGLKREAKDSQARLANLGVEVVGKERYEPSVRDLNLERIVSTIPVARPGSKVIQLVDEDDKVVGFRVVTAEEAAPPREEIVKLKEELDEIRAAIPIMRRDAEMLIKSKVSAPEHVLELVSTLTRNLVNEMPTVALKDVEDKRAARMKEAKIETVLDLVESPASRVSDAVDERMANAVTYINNAGDLTLDVARYISSELEREKVEKKEDLKKLDKAKIKEITAELNKRMTTKKRLSEEKVTEVIHRVAEQ
jgi:hypothetical protein